MSQNQCMRHIRFKLKSRGAKQQNSFAMPCRNTQKVTLGQKKCSKIFHFYERFDFKQMQMIFLMIPHGKKNSLAAG